MKVSRKSRPWEQVRLDTIKTSNKYSLVGGPFGSNLTSADYVDVPGVPVIRGTNLGAKEGRFIDDGFVYVSAEKAEELSQNLAFPGDVVFTQRGTLGQVAIIPNDARFSKYVVSQSQMKLTVDPEKADRRYVYYAFRSPFSQLKLLSQTQSTGVPHINLGILRAFEIPLPPLAEQKRIADILDKADAIRRKRQQAIELTEQFLRSTFLEMFGDPVTNPRGLKMFELGNVVDFVSGGTPSKSNDAYWDGDFPWVSPKDMKKVLIDGAIDHVSTLAFEETMLKKIPKSSVLFVIRGMILVHTVPVAINTRPVAINQDMKALLPCDKLLPEFLLWSLRCQHDYILSKVATAAHGTKRLEVDTLKALAIPNISIGDQQRFVEIIHRHQLGFEKSINSFKEANSLFGSLVQRAFKGEL